MESVLWLKEVFYKKQEVPRLGDTLVEWSTGARAHTHTHFCLGLPLAAPFPFFYFFHFLVVMAVDTVGFLLSGWFRCHVLVMSFRL